MTSFGFSSCCNLTELAIFFISHFMYSVMYNLFWSLSVALRPFFLSVLAAILSLAYFLKCLSRVFEERKMMNPFCFSQIGGGWLSQMLNSSLSSIDTYQCNRDKLFFLLYFLLFRATDNEGIDSLLTNINFHIVYVESNVCWILFSDVVITFL